MPSLKTLVIGVTVFFLSLWVAAVLFAFCRGSTGVTGLDARDIQQMRYRS